MKKILTSSWDVWGRYHGKMHLSFNDGKFNRRNRLYILGSGNGFRNSMMRLVWIMDNSILCKVYTKGLTGGKAEKMN